MKRCHFLCALGVLILVPAFRAQVVSDDNAFRNQFRQAVADDDYGLMQGLVISNREKVVRVFRDLESDWCSHSLVEGAGAATWKILEQLALIHKLKNRDDTCVDRASWLKTLTPEQKQAKVDLWKLLGQGDPLYKQAKSKPTDANVQAAEPVFRELGVKAAEAGDRFWEASAYYYLALLADLNVRYLDSAYWYLKAMGAAREGPGSKWAQEYNLDSLLRSACEKGRLSEKFLDASVPFEKAEEVYKENETKALAGPLELGGGGTGEVSAETVELFKDMPPQPNRHTEEVTWSEHDGFEVRPDPRTATMPMPFFGANPDWWFWPAVQVAKDAKAPFTLLPGGYELESDGGKLTLVKEGERPQRLKLKSGKPDLQIFKRVGYLDGTTGDVGLLLMEQPTTFKLNGIGLRFKGDLATVRARGATTARGKVRGMDLAIFDANANGAFNDYGQDAVIIGKGKTASVHPLSRYITIDGRMYEFKVDANGQKARTRPYDGPVAPLKFDFVANETPRYMLAQGAGEDATYFIDLMLAAEKPIWVRPGIYSFFSGEISSGTGRKAQAMRVSKGRSGTLSIEPGKMNIWKMGAAGETGFTFGFDAEVKERDAEIIIPGNKVKIYDCFGAEYETLSFGPPLPLVQVRKGEDGPVVVRGEMRPPDDSVIAEATTNVFYPKPLKLKKQFQGPAVITLEADYEPLGKITSTPSTFGN